MIEINEDRLAKLIEETNPIFASEQSYIELPSDKPIIFAGDTHGDYYSTKIVLSFLGKHRVVFLGDYVDRAREKSGSIKNLELLLAAKIKHPNDLILLRGNHEFESAFSRYGFSNELKNAGMMWMQLAFEELFSNLPYIVATQNGVIAMHGGVPDIDSVNQLISLPKGIKKCKELNLVSQIVWNDHTFCRKQGMNRRGIQDNVGRNLRYPMGFLYHEPFFSEIMKKLEKKVLLRGHEEGSKGYAIENRILTIFTSSKYALYGNIKGVYVAKLNPQKTINNALDLEIIHL